MHLSIWELAFQVDCEVGKSGEKKESSSVEKYTSECGGQKLHDNPSWPTFDNA